MAGGAIGVAARATVTVPIDAGHPLIAPGITLAVNLAGAFLLGILVARLGDAHPRWRQFAGSGILGGFTSYSAFAVHVLTTGTAAPLVGLALIIASLAGGVLAAAAGLSLGSRTTDEEAP